MEMNSKYIGYSTGVRCTTFIPCVLGFILFISLVIVYGRFPPNKVSRRRGRSQTRRAWFPPKSKQGEPKGLSYCPSRPGDVICISKHNSCFRPTDTSTAQSLGPNARQFSPRRVVDANGLKLCLIPRYHSSGKTQLAYEMSFYGAHSAVMVCL